MTMASRVKWYLDSHHFHYDEMRHGHTATSLQTAREGRILPEFLAKAVLLEDERGYVIAVLPASDHVSLRALADGLGRDLELASEAELESLFPDCEVGAVPPLGPAYGIPIVVEERILGLPTVYFEAGDHEDLVSMAGEEFARLMEPAARCHFSVRH